MIILSLLVNDEDPPVVVPLSFPLPLVLLGMVAEDTPVPSDLERSRVEVPISRCWIKLALGEEDPGFVVPTAQMMLSVVPDPT